MALYDNPAATYDSGLRYDEVAPPQPKAKRMAQVKLGLKDLNPEQKVALARQIVTAMTGNANFTTPNPTLAAITTAANALETKINAYNSAKAAAEAALADRDASAQELDALVTQEGAYVQNVSAGDAVKIEGAGMAVRAGGTPVGVMPKVLDLAVTEGDFEGTLDAIWKPVRGASSYEVQVSPDPPGAWAPKMTSTKSSATVEGLTSASKLWVRVRAVGANNQPGPWSDPATKVVP